MIANATHVIHAFNLITLLALAVLVYHYLGYPLLMALWASVRPRPTLDMGYTPRVSLIIAAYNEAAVIGEKIANSLQLDYPADQLEIIVVTDGSTDETPDIVARYASAQVKLLHEPARRGKSAAINRAVTHASGDVLLFSDANALYDAATVRLLARHFADPTVGGVSGKKGIQKSDAGLSESTGAYWRYESAIKRWESQTGATVAVVGEMMAVRRTLFVPIPGHMINDDAYLATDLLRRGYRVLYEPEAGCWETAALSTHDEVIRRRRINAGRYQLLFQPRLWPWRNPVALFQLVSHKFLRLLLPFFMIAALVGNLLALAGNGEREQKQKRPFRLMQFTFLGQVAFYGLAVWGWWAERQQQRRKLPAIAYYVVSGNLSALQGFVRFIRGQQTVLWEKARREL
jgi:poly-beta-1,6-N-acetyl-D-glucosamine synthase